MGMLTQSVNPALAWVWLCWVVAFGTRFGVCQALVFPDLEDTHDWPQPLVGQRRLIDYRLSGYDKRVMIGASDAIFSIFQRAALFAVS